MNISENTGTNILVKDAKVKLFSSGDKYWIKTEKACCATLKHMCEFSPQFVLPINMQSTDFYIFITLVYDDKLGKTHTKKMKSSYSSNEWSFCKNWL